MNIGFLISSTYVGGMERQVSYLTEQFEKNGHKTFVYTTSHNISFSKAKVNISHKKIWRLFYSRYSAQLGDKLFVKYLNSHNLDVLIAFQVGSIEIINKINNLINKPLPVIANLRGIKFAFDEKLKVRHINALKTIDLIVCNSKKGEELINKSLITKQTQEVVCIKNIVKVQDARPINSKTFNILFAANLKKVKDPMTFLAAIKLLKTKRVNIKVKIAGGGELIQVMKNFVNHNKLNDIVSFLGVLTPNKVPYSDSHLVVSSSLREASSNTILEAIANGCCVVGTKTGGTTELLENKVYGKLFEVGNSEDLANKIFEFAKYDFKELEKISEIGKREIIENHGEESIYREYFKIIQEAHAA